MSVFYETDFFEKDGDVSIIHVDFIAEHQTFYERCDFQTGLGGIIEG